MLFSQRLYKSPVWKVLRCSVFQVVVSWLALKGLRSSRGKEVCVRSYGELMTGALHVSFTHADTESTCCGGAGPDMRTAHLATLVSFRTSSCPGSAAKSLPLASIHNHPTSILMTSLATRWLIRSSDVHVHRTLTDGEQRDQR